MSSSVKLFAGIGSDALAQKIAKHYGQDLGKSTSRKFSDGELYYSFDESIRGCDVFLIQSTNGPSDNIIELLLMIDAAKRASAKTINLVVPYYGYARQDRKDKPRVSIAAKLMANLVQAAGATRLMTCDLHADQIQGFFDIPVDHLIAGMIFVPYINNLNLDNLIFAAPDVGSTKRVREFAKFFKADMVVCDKHRKRANEVASMQVIGDVTDKNVILVDDIIDTAGTLTKAANLLKEKGAKSVRAFCTHPILSGSAYENVDNSSLEELVVTDSIPLKGSSDKIHVASMAPLFADAIKRIHGHESISKLFEQ
ncbi:MULTISPECIES: ribose-phosphate pyrophosphokinase [Reichenbachiella]|uniref:ribose-phosphate diphosphokinase n=1 Tax=Reichenbachiella agariperforans TaxID=156994 RepID=A0A1M6L2R9_REIAG|nr:MULTISPECIES: ribose-phosphate pyrophosphokinase [Reichenbachiella]MBU2913767.1 ribose-phosphate pyrophosphokinase [Reichenbachiella agariperforans]RJE74304.1 ribose-phosphate pyrophosphokinase [Reichenbachiella sp. MSK19-1]SHJ65521.1 ribose-phosphate pyrophosphokinase [Reichenbachiella agariperforans]